MALLSRIKSPDWADGDILTASDLKAEFNSIVNGLNGAADISILTLTTSGNATIGGNVLVTGNASTFGGTNVKAALVPIGTIIAHYDFNANLASFIVSANWKSCNGQSATINGISETLPDLSGRYLVGFGGATDGATDIATATWGTTVQGNALHQIDVSHTHTGPSHTHTGPSHTHPLSSAGVALIDVSTSANKVYTKVASAPGGNFSSTHGLLGTTGALDVATRANGSILDGATDAAGTGATGASGTGATSSTGSATQSIQPRSIRVRYFMRIL